MYNRSFTGNFFFVCGDFNELQTRRPWIGTVVCFHVLPIQLLPTKMADSEFPNDCLPINRQWPVRAVSTENMSACRLVSIWLQHVCRLWKLDIIWKVLDFFGVTIFTYNHV